jgi:hypothetical protein
VLAKSTRNKETVSEFKCLNISHLWNSRVNIECKDL